MSVAAAENTSARIVELIGTMPGCQIEDIIRVATDLSWNQVFGEIDHLSRSGQVLVTLKGRGEYMLSLPAHGEPEPYPRCDIAPVARAATESDEGETKDRVA